MAETVAVYDAVLVPRFLKAPANARDLNRPDDVGTLPPSRAIEATIVSFMMRVNDDGYLAGDAELAGISLDRTDPTPLHDQVAATIRRAIADGEAGPGGRIPQARDLAAVLGVNKNTVLRALRVLRDEGLVEMGRGRATTVAGNAQAGSVTTKAKELIEFARQRGYKRDELIALITRLT